MHMPEQVDTSGFRNALGQFATGVAVVTCKAPNADYVGVTVNSFNSVSLSPPLVLWSLSCASKNYSAFEQASHYGVSVLSGHQEHLSKRFSTFHEQRFDGVAVQEGEAGVPLIQGALAHFECKVKSRHREGDHVVLVGEVVRCTFCEGPALIYKAQQYAVL
jgi:flavin reductase (DIM6/NTAB) family NADH-FMN oxidoreductase RutF